MTEIDFYELMEKWTKDTGASSNPNRPHKNRDIITAYAKENYEARDNVITWALSSLEKDSFNCHNCFMLFYELVPERERPPALPAFYQGYIPIYEEMWKYWGYRRKRKTL